MQNFTHIEKATPSNVPFPQIDKSEPPRNHFDLLLGAAAWQRLAPAIRARFSHHLAPHESITYQGIIVETRMTMTGWLMAQLARIAGAPLPVDHNNGGTAAVVTVTEMPRGKTGRGGQFWTRIYGRANTFPQIIRSVKRFTGPTGLEEQVGGGLAMSLTLTAEHDKLTFSSAGFYLTIAGWRIKLPRFLAPGDLTVTHQDLGRGWFSFTLMIKHPVAGEILYQKSVFADPAPNNDKEVLNG